MAKQEIYTMKQFMEDYPDDNACLQALFERRYGSLEWCPNCGCEAKFYRVKNRRAYACVHCRRHVYPTAGTAMHRSTTKLTTWFYVLYLFSQTKNGVSAMEIQRHIGGSYKTSLRIGQQIRLAMKQDTSLLTGVVEMDEAYIGGRRRSSNRFSNKTPLLGAVERGGRVRVKAVDHASASTALPFLSQNVERGAELHTDESRIYSRVHKYYDHHTVKHGEYEFVRESDFTNSIEGFWGLLKPSLDGTYRSVSKKHLQKYVNEFVYRYNHRGTQIYPALMESIAQPLQKELVQHTLWASTS